MLVASYFTKLKITSVYPEICNICEIIFDTSSFYYYYFFNSTLLSLFSLQIFRKTYGRSIVSGAGHLHSCRCYVGTLKTLLPDCRLVSPAKSCRPAHTNITIVCLDYERKKTNAVKLRT